MTVSLYVHIPFCVSKCHYCDFLSVADMKQVPEYTDALINEILSYKGHINLVKTIYIGGGTPTSIPHEYLLKIIGALKTYPLEQDLEFTAEVNPGTASFKYLASLKDAGVNRLSIGYQTSNNALLKRLGRVSVYNDFKDCAAVARQAGFTNISADIMYALPGQSLNMLREDLDNLIGFDLKHISAYPLVIEKGTPFEGITPVDEETELAMYEITKQTFKDAGFIHYEISNYAKHGFESRHNTMYWRRGNYIGLGAGAHSFINDTRFANTRSLSNYIEGNEIIVSRERVTSTGAMEEFFFLGLRLSRGVDLYEFKKTFGVSALDLYGGNIKKLISIGLLLLNGDNLRLTKRGVVLSDYVFRELL